MPIPLGATLIEVLISLFILSNLLLGLDALHLTSLRAAKTAYYFSVSKAELNVMAGKLQVLKAVDATDAIHHWNLQNAEVLPQGRGKVLGQYPSFKIIIFWGDIASEDCQKNIIATSGCLSATINTSLSNRVYSS